MLTGCASKAVETAYSGASRYPMAERPAYYKLLNDQGKLTDAQYEELMRLWTAVNADQQTSELRLARSTPTELATAWQRREVTGLQPAAPSAWSTSAAPAPAGTPAATGPVLPPPSYPAAL